MSDFLIRHAINNIWCNPKQDRQAIIQPVLLGVCHGVYDTITIGRYTFAPPTKEDYYVYQIGHYPPNLAGIMGVADEWHTLTNLSTDSLCHFDLYTSDGIQLPKFEAYFRELENKTLILVVRKQKNVDLSKTNIFFRHYSNAFYQSQRSQPGDTYWVDGIRYDNNMEDVMVLLNRYYRAHEANKQVYVIYNGEYRDWLVPSDLQQGDSIEVIQDDSIAEVRDFPLETLNYFHSNLDNKRKYVVDLGPKQTLYYHDDVDIRIIRTDSGKAKRGRFFHRNMPTNVRMLASATYSIAVDQVDFLSDIFDNDNVHLRVVARRAGYDRPLVFEENRIHELNKLPVEARAQILTGQIQSIDIWTLQNLEASAYPKVMRLPTVSSANVLDLYRCYGYNAFSYYGAMNLGVPYTDSDTRLCRVPEAYLGGSVYEYDGGGRLAAVNKVRDGNVLHVCKDNAQIVEFTSTPHSETIMDYRDTPRVPYDPKAEYRFYHRLAGTQRWTDISNSVKWTVDGDEYVHDYESFSHEYIIRVSNWHLFRQYEYKENRGVLEVALTDDNNGTSELPFEKIHVRMNEKELVQDIDYFIGQSVIWIVTKEYRTFETEVITVRAEGFPIEDDMGYANWGEAEEAGWVINGLISRNSQYNIRDDRLFRCVVDGYLKERDIIDFFEDNYQAKGDLPNGKPYAVHFHKPPLQSLGLDKATQAIMESRAADVNQKVSNFLTLFYPAPPEKVISPIERRYQLVSTFIARILHDWLNGLFEIPQGRLTDAQLKMAVERYEYLLEFDPAITGVKDGLAEGVAAVRPHSKPEVVEVSAFQYTTLDRLSGIYLDGQVDMTGHLVIAVQ